MLGISFPSHLLPGLATNPPKLLLNVPPFAREKHRRLNYFSLSDTRTSQLFSVSVERTGSSNFVSNSLRSSDRVESKEGHEKGEEKSMFIMHPDEMQRWFDRKPSGFGEGKTYDTTIEDKIVEEMQQSRRAQLANINKLRNISSQNAAAVNKETVKSQEALETVQSGIEVRIRNIPKKRNIHRDLHAAFKDFSGILHIRPEVSGSKKTRDPICRGFAFIYLQSEEFAHRFVQMYTDQKIQFGKVQKQIRCEVTNTDARGSSEAPSDQSAAKVSQSAPPLEVEVVEMKEESDQDSDMDCFAWNAEEESLPEWSSLAVLDGTGTEIIYEEEDDMIFSDCEVIDVGIDDGSVLETNNNRSNSVKKIKKQVKGRSVRVKGKQDSRLNVPGAAKRLKVKEKAVLAGVLSKYGEKDDSGKT